LLPVPLLRDAEPPLSSTAGRTRRCPTCRP